MRAVRWLLVAVALACCCAAQVVTGRVLGFDGAPAGSAAVRYVSARGVVVGEVLTDAAGRYGAPRAVAADPSVLHVQLEGVVLTRDIRGVRGPIEVSFADAPHFTVRGHVVDPTGGPAAGIDLQLRSGEDDGWLAVATTDQRGAFAARVDRTVGHVVADPLGWRYRVDGPFRGDTGLAIDLRLARDEFFRLDGLLRDERGAPLAGAPLQAIQVDEAGQQQRRWRATSRADGRYTVWVNDEVDLVVLPGAAQRRGEVEGPWDADAMVDVDCRDDGFTLVIGQVLGADGDGVEGALLFGADAAGRKVPRPLGRSGRDGWFRVAVKRSAPAIVTEVDGQELRVAGPWSARRIVELRPGKSR